MNSFTVCSTVLEFGLIFNSIGGPRSALGSAIACGILLGVFEGVGVLVSRVFSEGQRPQMAPRESLLLSFAQAAMTLFITVPAGMTPQSEPSSSIPGMQ